MDLRLARSCALDRAFDGHLFVRIDEHARSPHH